MVYTKIFLRSEGWGVERVFKKKSNEKCGLNYSEIGIHFYSHCTFVHGDWTRWLNTVTEHGD